MKKPFRIIDPLNDDRAQKKIEAANAYDAAKVYFERQWYEGSTFNTMEIKVLDEKGKRWTVSVEVEMEPNFNISIVKDGKTPPRKPKRR